MPEAGSSDQKGQTVTKDSPPAAKIELFRSLFRGRGDVYPRRFESRKTGKAGYAPACANEWVRGVCEKPRIKCADCPNRRFLPVTDEVIRWHLSGRDDLGRDFVMGLYPMLQDETCYFLAADFDQEHLQEDSGAFLETCRRLDLPAALERSRSGNGGHVWFFFEEAISASLARKLGSHVLTETMEHRPEIGLGSYDRLFPNQDTLPKGGFGNLIALPLQKQARQRGNTLFLDEQFKPHPDQWSFLASVRKISRFRAEALVRDAESKGRIIGVRAAMTDEDDDVPWTAPPSRRRKDRPLSDRCRRALICCSRMESTLPKRPFLLGFAIACSGWLPFKTPNSTGRSRCDCRLTPSQGLSTARRIIRSISPCHEAAWRRCGKSCRR